MFIPSAQFPGQFELDEDALHNIVWASVNGSEDINTRAFILNAILAGAVFEPDIARLIALTIASTLSIGVQSTINVLNAQDDMIDGPDRVEAALAEGIL